MNLMNSPIHLFSSFSPTSVLQTTFLDEKRPPQQQDSFSDPPKAATLLNFPYPDKALHKSRQTAKKERNTIHHQPFTSLYFASSWQRNRTTPYCGRGCCSVSWRLYTLTLLPIVVATPFSAGANSIFFSGAFQYTKTFLQAQVLPHGPSVINPILLKSPRLQNTKHRNSHRLEFTRCIYPDLTQL